MKTSFLKSTLKVLVLALPALLTGCVVKDVGVQPGDALDATFSLTWQVNDEATGQAVDCVSIGADAVVVTSTNHSTGEVFQDVYDCLDGTGVTNAVDAGDYDVIVDLDSCGDAQCSDAVILSTSGSLGPFSIYSNVDTDLGHVVFLVK